MVNLALHSVQVQFRNLYSFILTEFRYLGHIISNQHKDDSDIAREIRCMYTRVNMLIRIFHKCSTELKIRLFRAYCMCLYGSALWTRFAAESLNKFRRCYHKCIKMFFGYSKYHSVTAVLIDLKLPSFNTIMHNLRYVYSTHWWSSGNMLIVNLRNIGIVPYV